jgi:hypothetical protein
MSHADEGTLHAYLDGELSPAERSRLDAHLAECPSCRDRLAEEQGLIERADRLLTLVAPPEGHVNRPVPLPHPRRRFVVPGAWAASIAAAFLAGWILRPASGFRGDYANYRPTRPGAEAVPSVPSETLAQARRAANRDAATVAQAPVPSARRRQPQALDSRVDSSALFAAGAAFADTDHADRKPVVPGVVGNAAAPALRGAPPTPIPAAKVTIAPPPALARAEISTRAAIGTTWTVIAAGPARRLLGTDVVQIPGIPVRDILQNPLAPGQVMVEQEVARGTVIQLLQSVQLDSAIMAYSHDGNPLQKTVGHLQVSISGPLSTDSLLKLLQLVH